MQDTTDTNVTSANYLIEQDRNLQKIYESNCEKTVDSAVSKILLSIAVPQFHSCKI